MASITTGCGARRMADSVALLVDEILPHQPMRQWVLSVPFPLRFLFASKPAVMGKVLAIVYRTIATHLTHKACCTKTTAHTGAVTIIQCFGGSVNLNIHMLFLDGVYVDNKHGSSRFRWVKAPTSAELAQLTRIIAHRVATQRLSMTRYGQVRYELKTPCDNGTTHVVFEPLDFISRLVSLIPKPCVNLTRFNGVFAPNSQCRALVTPARKSLRNSGMNWVNGWKTTCSMTLSFWLYSVYFTYTRTAFRLTGPLMAAGIQSL